MRTRREANFKGRVKSRFKSCILPGRGPATGSASHWKLSEARWHTNWPTCQHLGHVRQHEVNVTPDPAEARAEIRVYARHKAASSWAQATLRVTRPVGAISGVSSYSDSYYRNLLLVVAAGTALEYSKCHGRAKLLSQPNPRGAAARKGHGPSRRVGTVWVVPSLKLLPQRQTRSQLEPQNSRKTTTMRVNVTVPQAPSLSAARAVALAVAGTGSLSGS
jgi:hypothetical protein